MDPFITLLESCGKKFAQNCFISQIFLLSVLYIFYCTRRTDKYAGVNLFTLRSVYCIKFRVARTTSTVECVWAIPRVATARSCMQLVQLARVAPLQITTEISQRTLQNRGAQIFQNLSQNSKHRNCDTKRLPYCRLIVGKTINHYDLAPGICTTLLRKRSLAHLIDFKTIIYFPSDANRKRWLHSLGQ